MQITNGKALYGPVDTPGQSPLAPVHKHMLALYEHSFVQECTLQRIPSANGEAMVGKGGQKWHARVRAWRGATHEGKKALLSSTMLR